MPFDPQDPRWTALVLDPESLSAEDRSLLTRQAAEDDECRRFVDELRTAAAVLGNELKQESLSPARPEELEQVVKNALQKPTPAGKSSWSWRKIALSATAAAILLGLTVYLMRPARKEIFAEAQGEIVKLPIRAAGPLHPVPPSESSMKDVDELSAVEATSDLAADYAVASSGPMPGAKHSPDPAANTRYYYSRAETLGLKAAPGSGPMGGESSRGAIVALSDGLGLGDEQRWRLRQQTDANFEIAKPDDGAPVPVNRANGLHPHPHPFAHNTEAYPVLIENPFIKVAGQDALSTFSIDVDTASYSNVRRFLTQNTAPPPGAVRIEELINYFQYDYAPPTGEHPFAVHAETAQCPWEPKHRLARIALKGRVIEQDKRPASNLVFLLDVSGSMNEPNKLPLVKESIRMLVEQLTENDRVAIAVYAGSSGLVLDSTTGDRKEVILAALDSLQPGGSTNGAAGITTAYDAAVKGFIAKGTNRVILCTDGDFNVGTTSDDELVNLITEKAKSGVFLSVLGFGMGNYKDAKMLQLSDKGNGNYAYIDNLREGRKVLVEQMTGTLITIAKDVKIQVEFNPARVAAYRLIGYEKRMLRAEDFKDDTKDAGEIGAGHTVTALYEIVPAGEASPAKPVDPLVFQQPNGKPELDAELAKEAFRVKLRYKQPDGEKSTELQVGVQDEGKAFAAAGKDFQFAAAVASFGMLLRNSEFKGNHNLAAVAEIAASAKGEDANGYRAEFVELVKKATAVCRPAESK